MNSRSSKDGGTGALDLKRLPEHRGTGVHTEGWVRLEEVGKEKSL